MRRPPFAFMFLLCASTLIASVSLPHARPVRAGSNANLGSRTFEFSYHVSRRLPMRLPGR